MKALGRILNIAFIGFISLSAPALSQQDFTDKRIFSSSNPQTENSIAINPSNPYNILVCTNGTIVSGNVNVTQFYTIDGGQTWNGSENTPNGIALKGDPVAIFDVNNHPFFAAKGASQDILYVFKSTDGGQTWQSPVNAVNGGTLHDLDKPHLMADLSGTNMNNLYAAWTETILGTPVEKHILFSRSNDGGGTFLAKQTIDNTTGADMGANIAVGPSGQVYVCWAEQTSISNATENSLGFIKSTDGGATFPGPKINFTIAGINNSANNGQVAFGNTRVNSFPSMGVDRTGTGRAKNGWIYIVYAANSSTPPSMDANVYLRRSTNDGNTWQAPIAVNNDATGTQQWFPSIAVDQISGYIFVSYYNMRATNNTTTRYIAVSTNGGDSFTRSQVSDTTFVPAPLSGEYGGGYMGDYYEIAAYGYNAYACWSDSRPGTATLQAFVSKFSMPVQITVDQKLSDGTRIGSVNRWNVNSFTPVTLGQPYPVQGGSPEILLGDRNLYSNQKYYRWNAIGDVKNHHLFSIDGSVVAFASNFRAVFSGAKLQNVLYEFPGTNGGFVEFKDPWYVGNTTDYYDSPYGYRNLGTSAIPITGSSPLSLDVVTNFKGVLQNIDVIPANSYYSVRSQLLQPMTINGQALNWAFYGWSPSGASLSQPDPNPPGYDQKAVKFTSTNATISANYKAHLASSSSISTSYNNQRKLAKRNTSYHLVYQSGQDVWYTSSTDNGAQWAPEQRVSSTTEGTQRCNPAIDLDALNNVFVVYEIVVDGTHRAVAIKQKVNNSWQWINTGETFLASTDMKPVIEVLKTTYPDYQLTVVVQANGYATSDPGLYYLRVPGNGGAYQIGKVSETTSSSVNPTLVFYNLAYQDGNAIYQKRIDYTTTPISFSARNMVSSNFVNGRLVTDISNPNIAIREVGDYEISRRPVIGWQARDLVFYSFRPIFVRHPVGTNPDGTPSFVTTVFDWGTWNAHGKTPTVNCYTTPTGLGYQNPDVSLVWQDDPTNPDGSYQNVVAANKINGTWGTQTSLANPAQYSSAAQGDVDQSASGGSLVAWSGTSGPLFPVNAWKRTNGGIPKIGWISRNYSRSVNIDLSSLGINGLSGMCCISVKETLDVVFTSLATMQSLHENFLEWRNGSANTVLLPYTMWLSDITLPGKLSTNQLIEKIVLLQFSPEIGPVQNLNGISVSDVLTLWTGHGAQLEGTFESPPGGAVSVSFAQPILSKSTNLQFIELVGQPDSSSPKAAIRHATFPGQPGDFMMSQNYPNPFNPVTQIKYTLPENVRVTLKVYDVLGQVVSTLVDADQAAGYKSVEFNPGRLPSGIYYYRLTAGSFTDIKKMLLLK